MDSSIKRSSWKAGHNRRQSLDPERCPTDSSRNLTNIPEWEAWLLNSMWTLGFFLPPPSHCWSHLSCCLIEPCFTQKATLSLFVDRRLWRHLPFSALPVRECGPPIIALLYMVMKVWRLNDKAVMPLTLWPGVNTIFIYYLQKEVLYRLSPSCLISEGCLAPKLCFDGLAWCQDFFHVEKVK